VFELNALVEDLSETDEEFDTEPEYDDGKEDED
jgi:hypothetical protein